MVGDSIDFFTGIAAQFDDEDGGRVALDEEAVFLLFYILLAEFQNVTVHQLYGRRMVFQGDKVAEKALLQGIAMGADHHLLLGRQGVEVDFDFGDES